MLESTWLFIGTTALLATAFAVSTQTRMSRLYDRYADPIAMVGGVMAAISWGMLAYGSLDVEVVGDSVTYSFGQPAVTFWCLMMALPPLYVALTGPIEGMKRAVETAPEDV